MRLAPALLCAALTLLGGVRSAAAITVVVPGNANVFGAGHATPPDPDGGGAGVLPPEVALTAGANQALTIVNATGLVSCCGSLTYLGNGPDGGLNAGGSTNISSWDGIAGIVDSAHTMFLVGVFLTDAEPADPAPARLDFSPTALGEGFLTLSPLIGQVFFVGDGLTGTGDGATQTFLVPPTATRLFLGFADSQQFGNPNPLPGYYDDNLGSVTVDLEIQSLNPTPVRTGSWGHLKSIYR